MSVINLSRRSFLKSTAFTSAGLTLGFYLPALTTSGTATASATPFKPNPFVRIGTDGVVTVFSKHLEMGQGTYTGLATLVAEELDADWSQIRVEGAPAGPGHRRQHGHG